MTSKTIFGSPDIAAPIDWGRSRFVRVAARWFSPRDRRSANASPLSDDARRQLQRDCARAEERLHRLSSITRPLW